MYIELSDFVPLIDISARCRLFSFCRFPKKVTDSRARRDRE